LLAEHRQKGGEEGSGKASEKDGLDLDKRLRRSVPLWESGNVVSERGVIDFVDKDAEEGSSFVAGVRLQLGIDLNDESGGDGGE
jgi:hypothetical protein